MVAKIAYIMYILTMNVKGKQSRLRRGIKILFMLGLLVSFAVVAFASIVILTTPIPDTDEFNSREIVESTKIYDRSGEILLYELYNEEKRTIVSFEEIMVRFSSLYNSYKRIS